MIMITVEDEDRPDQTAGSVEHVVIQAPGENEKGGFEKGGTKLFKLLVITMNIV